MTSTPEKYGRQDSARNEHFSVLLEDVLKKLREDPSTITTEDARRLSENAEARDLRSAKIISAVEAFAAASEIVHEVDPTLGQAPHTSLLTVVNDLKVAVEQNPAGVTTEVLKTAQAVVSKMQKAVGHTNAPHPELEIELQEEIAKIEPKVVEGTVTIEEANHLHSLEARAHGHTEKGGITSIAQSVAAKRERQLTLSSGSSPASTRSRGNSKTFTPQEQSHHAREASLHKVEDTIKPQLDEGTVSEANANLLHSRKTRAQSKTDKGGLVASAQSLVSKKRTESLSDRSNASPNSSFEEYKHRKEQSQHDREVNLKLAEMSLEPKIKSEQEKGGLVSQAMASAHKRENSHPAAEVK
ncbi:hypothetical protein FB567DRAFT_560910 [Paraphoma chrysanthemicola]|uniref:SMP domain-containing protein n=1 Tax=Paraphoma chrysanthemicola TaxID=798071 RepID=A0A8K0R599_9PLEO|nr:hypothetical protein FB567DRAFT_560910 [Paraphoma chrysanthemicola]